MHERVRRERRVLVDNKVNLHVASRNGLELEVTAFDGGRAAPKSRKHGRHTPGGNPSDDLAGRAGYHKGPLDRPGLHEVQRERLSWVDRRLEARAPSVLVRVEERFV